MSFRAIRRAAARRLRADGPTARRITATSIAALAAGWSLVALATYVLTDAAAARFFDLPLSAFLAGQGVLVCAVLLTTWAGDGD